MTVLAEIDTANFMDFIIISHHQLTPTITVVAHFLNQADHNFVAMLTFTISNGLITSQKKLIYSPTQISIKISKEPTTDDKSMKIVTTH